MTTSPRSADYPLGNTDAEHERLIRQAARVDPITERFFREAGIGRGQRVLDLGSGVGDVAMLVARLVGPTGEVVAIERDPKAITKARARVTEAGFHNVSFNESNVDEILDGKLFDAAVGRFILMYLPDPVATLRSISQAVRPGGVFVFQERSTESVAASLQGFIDSHSAWVIEGCYGELVRAASAQCTLLVFLNPGIDACLANNFKRPWEPHKYPSLELQNNMLSQLQEWVAGYYQRKDAWSYRLHREIFDAFTGPKVEHRELGAYPEMQ